MIVDLVLGIGLGFALLGVLVWVLYVFGKENKQN